MARKDFPVSETELTGCFHSLCRAFIDFHTASVSLLFSFVYTLDFQSESEYALYEYSYITSTSLSVDCFYMARG